MTTLDPSSYSPVVTTETQGMKGWLQRHPLLGFGLLAYGWTWLGASGFLLAMQFELVPADAPALGLANQVAAFGPAVAALIVIASTQGRGGLELWLRSLMQWRVGMHWYLFVLFGIPLLALLGESMVHGGRPFQALVQQWPILFTRYLPYVALTTSVVVFAGYSLLRNSLRAYYAGCLSVHLYNLTPESNQS